MRDIKATSAAESIDETSTLTSFKDVLTARFSRRRALLGGLGTVLVAACGESDKGDDGGIVGT